MEQPWAKGKANILMLSGVCYIKHGGYERKAGCAEDYS